MSGISTRSEPNDNDVVLFIIQRPFSFECGRSKRFGRRWAAAGSVKRIRSRRILLIFVHVRHAALVQTSQQPPPQQPPTRRFVNRQIETESAAQQPPPPPQQDGRGGWSVVAVVRFVRLVGRQRSAQPRPARRRL
jgi:hypothetical protein